MRFHTIGGSLCREMGHRSAFLTQSITDASFSLSLSYPDGSRFSLFFCNYLLKFRCGLNFKCLAERIVVNGGEQCVDFGDSINMNDDQTVNRIVVKGRAFIEDLLANGRNNR